MGRLTLTRRAHEKVVIGGAITLTVVSVGRGQVRLGIDAPKDVPVFREELLNRPHPEARKD